MQTKQDVLMSSLMIFYRSGGPKKDANLNRLISLLNHDGLSLRLIDYYLTNYTKLYRKATYDEYKNQLKSFSKKFFDPFCRSNKIDFYYDAGKKIETSIGQLNIFRWLMISGEIDYIIKNNAKIKNEMDKRKENSARKKRTSSISQKNRSSSAEKDKKKTVLSNQ